MPAESGDARGSGVAPEAGEQHGATAGHVAALAEQIATSTPAGGRCVVLIDGGSGSGKSTLATVLGRELGAALVRLDDLYPGWHGLQSASRMVVDDVLMRHRWTRWDWDLERPAETHLVDPARPLIIEGCGSISRRSAPLATAAIWVEMDPAARRRNALLRDGDGFAPYWEMWAEQEREHIAREDPRSLAGIVVAGEDFSPIR